jgi:hypothetical protein
MLMIEENVDRPAKASFQNVQNVRMKGIPNKK